MMSWIVPRRAPSFTISSVESFRIHDKLKAFQVFKHDVKLVSATLLTLTFTFCPTTFVQGHHIFRWGTFRSTIARIRRRGEYVENWRGEGARYRFAVDHKFQFDSQILEWRLDPRESGLGRVEFQPPWISGVVQLNFPTTDQLPWTTKRRYPKIEQHLQLGTFGVVIGHRPVK